MVKYKVMLAALKAHSTHTSTRQVRKIKGGEGQRKDGKKEGMEELKVAFRLTGWIRGGGR